MALTDFVVIFSISKVLPGHRDIFMYFSESGTLAQNTKELSHHRAAYVKENALCLVIGSEFQLSSEEDEIFEKQLRCHFDW